MIKNELRLKKWYKELRRKRYVKDSDETIKRGRYSRHKEKYPFKDLFD